MKQTSKKRERANGWQPISSNNPYRKDQFQDNTLASELSISPEWPTVLDAVGLLMVIVFPLLISL